MMDGINCNECKHVDNEDFCNECSVLSEGCCSCHINTPCAYCTGNLFEEKTNDNKNNYERNSALFDINQATGV